MAILNATPDSFHDGGSFPTVDLACRFACEAVRDGADAIDIGGESTRPGAEPVSPEEQVQRTVPIIRAIREAGLSIPITIDTTRGEVATAALDAGADAVNDVSAGRDDPGMFDLVARRGAGIILMHRLTDPSRDRFSDQYDAPPAYQDVVGEVRAFLLQRVREALAAGINPDSICIDPGLGFGKSVDQNMELIRRTDELANIGLPILSALSRKSFVGRVSLERDSHPSERLWGTVGLSVVHAMSGAAIVRVHDVRAHVEALRPVTSFLSTASNHNTNSSSRPGDGHGASG